MGARGRALTDHDVEFVIFQRGVKQFFERGLEAMDFVIDPVGSGKPGASVAADASARDALSAMLATDADSVTLIDENGAARGTITLAAMRARLIARGDGSASEPRPLSNNQGP